MNIGDRVKLSDKALEAFIGPRDRKREDARGRYVGEASPGYLKVVWDGLQEPRVYHTDFIAPSGYRE